MKYYLLFSLVFALSSCASKEKKTLNKTRLHWQSFSLTLEDTNVVIGSITSDSLEIRNRNNETKFYFIEKNNRDSLFYWANDMIEYKEPKLMKTCSDYIGKLTIKIRYSSTLAKHAYLTSVCDWSSLSNETRKIDLLLDSIIKN